MGEFHQSYYLPKQNIRKTSWVLLLLFTKQPVGLPLRCRCRGLVTRVGGFLSGGPAWSDWRAGGPGDNFWGHQRLYFIGFLRIIRNSAPQVSSQVRGVASCTESVHSPPYEWVILLQWWEADDSKTNHGDAQACGHLRLWVSVPFLWVFWLKI